MSYAVLWEIYVGLRYLGSNVLEALFYTPYLLTRLESSANIQALERLQSRAQVTKRIFANSRSDEIRFTWLFIFQLHQILPVTRGFRFLLLIIPPGASSNEPMTPTIFVLKRIHKLWRRPVDKRFLVIGNELVWRPVTSAGLGISVECWQRFLTV